MPWPLFSKKETVSQSMQGHIRRRGKQSWAIVIDVGRDSNGRRRQRWHSIKGTKNDAQNELIRILRSFQTGEYVEPSKLTVKAYLERWLADYVKSNTSAKTAERYAEIVDCHISPNLGFHRLTKLRPLHIQAFYSQALESGRRDGKGGLSPRSVLHIHRVLHQALAQAVRWQLLGRNPGEAVEAPRPAIQGMQVLDERETAQLLRKAANTRLYVPIMLAVTTGMRRGEILALTWADTDLKTGALVVTKSVEQTKAGLSVKAPKTAKGRRTIPLPSTAVAALRQHKVTQSEHRLKLGSAYQDFGIVCAAPNGLHWQPDTFSNQFHSFLKGVGLREIRFHDLRHTHATQLLRQSVHPKIVAERLGHSSITITLDTYSHVGPGLQEAATRQLDRVLRKAIREIGSN